MQHASTGAHKLGRTHGNMPRRPAPLPRLAAVQRQPAGTLDVPPTCARGWPECALP